jgi:16S rRNA processing protein RimM
MPEQRILLGVVGRPHGVRGLLHVHSYTANPADLVAYGALTDEAGRAWTLVWRGEGVAELRDAAGKPVADRTAAEKLVNTRLYVERDRLPEPDEDEFYLADLVGLTAMSPDGAALGRVDAVHDYGAGTSLEIGALLVPFTRACVPSVDIAAGRVVIVMPSEVLVASDSSPSPLVGEGRGEGSMHGAAAPGPGKPPS